jgi:hypothetical protein
MSQDLIPIDPEFADLDGHVRVAVGDVLRDRCTLFFAPLYVLVDCMLIISIFCVQFKSEVWPDKGPLVPCSIATTENTRNRSPSKRFVVFAIINSVFFAYVFGSSSVVCMIRFGLLSDISKLVM